MAGGFRGQRGIEPPSPPPLAVPLLLELPLDVPDVVPLPELVLPAPLELVLPVPLEAPLLVPELLPPLAPLLPELEDVVESPPDPPPLVPVDPLAVPPLPPSVLLPPTVKAEPPHATASPALVATQPSHFKLRTMGSSGRPGSPQDPTPSFKLTLQSLGRRQARPSTTAQPYSTGGGCAQTPPMHRSFALQHCEAVVHGSPAFEQVCTGGGTHARMGAPVVGSLPV
jgi:hypothetical protein